MPSILPDFEYDIFISYRQNDNKSSAVDKREGWVTNFVEALKNELEATLKNPVSIYFDENPHDGLLETHQINATLDNKLKCIVFLPVISQTYCHTEGYAWSQEFLPFIEMADADSLGMNIRLGNGNVVSRVLPIRIHDLDLEDHNLLEEKLSGPLRSIDFIYKEPGVNRPLKPQDKRELNQEKTSYHNQVNKVANALKDIGLAVLRNDQSDQSASSQTLGVRKIKRKTIGQKSRLTIAFVAVALISLLAYSFLGDSIIEEPEDKSIAVLPFDNMSGNPDNKYFSDGMQEAVLNHLAKIEDLRVISRTSMEQFRDKDISIPQVADAVDVAYVLEGSVQRSGDQVRITVQLINGETDVHIWSENYDRELQDVFKVQGEIAKTVAEKLHALINPQVAATMEEVPTQNMEAYEYYLRGNEILISSETYNQVNEAASFYKKAIELEPNFAEPYVSIAWATFATEYDIKDNKDLMDSLDNLLTIAKSINPELGDIYSLRGWLSYMGLDLGREQTIRELERSIELKPNNPDAYNLLFHVYATTPPIDYKKAMLALQNATRTVKGERLSEMYDRVGFMYMFLEEYDESLKYYNEVADRSPSWQNNSARWWLNIANGKYKEALKHAVKNKELYPNENKSYEEVARTYVYLQEFDSAKKYYDIWLTYQDQGRLDNINYNLNGIEYLFMLFETGEVGKASKLAKDRINFLENLEEYSPEFGIANNAGAYLDICQLYTLLGNEEKAIENLKKAEKFEFPWGSLSQIGTSPIYKNLRANPKVQEILNNAWDKKFEWQREIDNLTDKEGMSISLNK